MKYYAHPGNTMPHGTVFPFKLVTSNSKMFCPVVPKWIFSQTVS